MRALLFLLFLALVCTGHRLCDLSKCMDCASSPDCYWCTSNNGFTQQGRCLPLESMGCPLGSGTALVYQECVCLTLGNASVCQENSDCSWYPSTLTCSGKGPINTD